MLARKKTQSPDTVAARNDATLSHLYFAACSFLLQTWLLRLSHAVAPPRLHASSPRTHRRRRSRSVSGNPGPFLLGSASRDDKTYSQKGERQNTKSQHEVPTISSQTQTSICELGHTRICRHSVKKKWSKCSSDFNLWSVMIYMFWESVYVERATQFSTEALRNTLHCNGSESEQRGAKNLQRHRRELPFFL